MDENLGSNRDNLKKFVQKILTEENISSYELSKRTGTNETLWKNLLDDRIKMPDSGAVVALADYKKVPLDETVGRDIIKERELKASKTIPKTETKLPSFIAGLSPETLQSIESIKKSAPSLVLNEDAAKYKGPAQKKSFVEQEQARRANKSREKSR
ncbi:MAG TPA: hypothetical protein LFW21_01585 [Rickettsia endosymbiont of Pyrocoelia pectoralis]|nr:hypothetical protein [Rickettsia endosymbiont of Pyrocoelia pectoralis]